MADLRETLIRARLIPPESIDSGMGGVASPDGDLLSGLICAWERAGGGQAGEQLRRCQAQGARLTQIDRHGLGRRLAWWPRGEPAGRRVGMVSSRLGREPEQHKSWFTVLRAACLNLDPRREMLLAVATTAAGRFVQRAGQLFGLPVLRVECAAEDLSLEAWHREVLQPVKGVEPDVWRVSLSPPLSKMDEPVAPIADRAAMAMSDRVIAIRVRSNGHQHRLLTARLGDADSSPASVYLALGRDLVPRPLAEQWMDQGAIGWVVLNTFEQPSDQAPPWARETDSWRSPSEIIPPPPSDDWPYLTHCTRRRQGPWPGETEEDYLDDLILDHAGADHSALASLWRIVHAARLSATAELTRGDCRVVCFTEVPLAELHRLRRFRAHLSRWDFEPYGICIRRDWLEQRGARPARYGDESTWEQLDAADCPFFQRAESKTSTGRVIDWTVEREWRIVGDLPLDQIPADAALLFVPTTAEAQQLAAVSPWPVTVLEYA